MTNEGTLIPYQSVDHENSLLSVFSNTSRSKSSRLITRGWRHQTKHRLPYNVILVLPSKESTNDEYKLTLAKAQPVIDIAVEDTIKWGWLPRDWMNITFHDSRYWEDKVLAERYSATGVVQAFCERRLDAIFGFTDAYSLATVSKISAAFDEGIPVMTTTGLNSMIGSKKSYPYVTRMSGSNMATAKAVYHFIANEEDDKEKKSINLKYKHFVFMYHDKRRALNRGHVPVGENTDNAPSSHCYFSLHAIKIHFRDQREHFKELWLLQTPNVAFDEELNRTRDDVREWVKIASLHANVIILCASPDTVREIMLAAHSLGMATSGEYVFINIDVSAGSHAEKPWFRANVTDDSENEMAKEAYRALKTISLRRSDFVEYKNFELRVKDRAEKKYNYSLVTGKEYEMNNFISAFYDAVLLYAIALNETLTEGLDPRNGKNITSKMWNRTFAGITGNVSIDSNGDRYYDYSLLDLDPSKDKFVEVAYYSGAQNQLKKITDFHWVKGPPKDHPVCGWDHLKCPKGYPAHVYALIGASILILLGFGFFFYRRYKFEVELAKMAWKIHWEKLDGEETKKKKTDIG